MITISYPNYSTKAFCAKGIFDLYVPLKTRNFKPLNKEKN